MPETQLKSLGLIFKESAQAVRRNLTLFIFLNTITILGTAWDIGASVHDKSHINGWSQIFARSFSNPHSGTKLNIWLTLCLLLAAIILYLIMEILAVRAARHRIVKFGDVWGVFKSKWWKIALTELMFLVIVGVGLIAFIVPGLYLLSRLALWPVIVIDQDISIKNALDQSWELTKNYKWIVLTTVLFGFILGLPTIIPVIGPLISTILTIAYSVALPIRYFELKNRSA